MNYTLKDEWTGTRFPAGGYPYVDARTGMKFDAMAGGINDRILDVQKHRRANPTVFPEQEWHDAGFIRQQIINFMCTKNTSLCIETDAIKIASNASNFVQTQNCPQCGSATDAKPEYCASCGGSKIKWWICACGQKF